MRRYFSINGRIVLCTLTRSALGMSKHALDRPNHKLILPPSKHLPNRLELLPIPRNGPRRMRLQIADLVRRDSSLGQRLFDHRNLSIHAGCGNQATASVVTESGTADDGGDWVAVTESVGEALEDDGAAAFAADVAVGGGVEGRGHIAGGKDADGGKLGVLARGTSEASTASSAKNGDESENDKHDEQVVKREMMASSEKES